MSHACLPMRNRTCTSALRSSAIVADSTRRPLRSLTKRTKFRRPGEPRSGQFYDAARQSQFNERMIAAFPPGSFDQNRSRSDLAARPVFIVGLPRSGTSLIEQILASHRSVWGAGELTDLHDILRGLPQLAGSPETAPVELLRNLDPSIAEIMARQYTDRLAAIAPEGAARVVDKMQDNIRLLGLIGLIFPGTA